MANRSCYERVAIFSNMFEIIVTPFRALACSVSATIAFDAVTLWLRTVRFGIRRSYASRFVNV